ncbi:MAG TPA: hypothetical protein VK737_07650 [Opitutales bacterium]|nr:hypothetical protein [Opitutales bacterium]
MKNAFPILCLLCAGALCGCQSASTSTTTAAPQTPTANPPTFGELNAQRQVNGQPPLTWDEYVEYTDPASNHSPPKDTTSHP